MTLFLVGTGLGLLVGLVGPVLYKKLMEKLSNL